MYLKKIIRRIICWNFPRVSFFTVEFPQKTRNKPRRRAPPTHGVSTLMTWRGAQRGLTTAYLSSPQCICACRLHGN
jgi:hypothetical protein